MQKIYLVKPHNKSIADHRDLQAERRMFEWLNVNIYIVVQP